MQSSVDGVIAEKAQEFNAWANSANEKVREMEERLNGLNTGVTVWLGDVIVLDKKDKCEVGYNGKNILFRESRDGVDRHWLSTSREIRILAVKTGLIDKLPDALNREMDKRMRMVDI